MQAREFRTHWLEMGRVVKASIALLVFSLAIGTVWAQVRNSTITGTVTDQSGAVVPKAIVTVTNQLTNESVKTQSGPVGDYAIPYLAAGRYSVSISAPGFESYRLSDVVVGTGVTAVGSTTRTFRATMESLDTMFHTALLLW